MKEKSKMECLAQQMEMVQNEIALNTEKIKYLKRQFNDAKKEGKSEEVLMDLHNQQMKLVERYDVLYAKFNSAESILMKEKANKITSWKIKETEKEIAEITESLQRIDMDISFLCKEREALFKNNSELVKRLEIEQRITDAQGVRNYKAREIERMKEKISILNQWPESDEDDLDEIEDDDINDIFATIDELEESLEDQSTIIEELRTRVKDYYDLNRIQPISVDVKHDIIEEKELRLLVDHQCQIINNLQVRIMQLEEELENNKNRK